jgi:hypothetical protein
MRFTNTSRLAVIAAVILLGGGLVWAQEATPPGAEETPADLGSEPAPAPEPAERTVELPPATVTAKAKRPTVVLGLGAGVYIPTSALGPNFLVGIDGAYALPWLDRKLGIGFGLAYSQPTTSGAISDDRVPGGTANYESTMRELVLDLLISYRFLSWDSVWSPHAGIGPVFYFLGHAVESLDHEQTETSTQVGFKLTVGADYRLGPGALIGEVRFPFATVAQKTTGESNVGAVSIVLGYRFRI